ncbi:MAG TPA: hypothetical protein VK186_26980 [Candidatus Deferrimicrobium sp.]|nr:hypothetical protein [Candidatus Deferrimicrobium sp.]
MEVKARNVAAMMNLHTEDVIELDVDAEYHRLIMKRKAKTLRENLLAGILASQEENIAFANDFDELDGEI